MEFFRRFTPPVIIAFMAGIYALEALVLIMTSSKLSSLFYLFVLNVLLTLLLLYQARSYDLKRLDFIRKINEDADNSLNATLDNMPIGVIRYNLNNFEPEWFNPFIDLIYKSNDQLLTPEIVRDIVKKSVEKNQYLAIGSKKYALTLDAEKHLVYLTDATSEITARADISDSRPVIGSISVDNYDEETDLITDSERTVINNFIATFFEQFAKDSGVFMRRISSNRYYLFSDYRILDKLIQNKFSVLKEFKKQSQARNISLSLSIGVSYGWNDFQTIGQTALNNLELALVRGGDQVVLKENTEQASPIYFGGNSESRTQKSRTRARAITTALKTIVSEAEKVFIVGHRFTDMDALGAAVAMKNFANFNGKEAFVVYDENQLLTDVGRAIKLMNESSDGLEHIVNLETAQSLKTENSLLIMVDHSKISQTLNQAFYESFEKLVVIDHHRRDSDFPNHALLSYIESSASSATELTVEILQFQDNRSKKMTNLEATIALAGVSVDTKSFSKGTNPRTFEVAAYLRGQGADNDLVKTILATDFAKYKKINEIVLHSEVIEEEVAIATGLYGRKYDNVTTAVAADTLLDMSGIVASFAITEHENGFISVSARSSKGYNVQSIMEKMGGGGHFNNAATQIYEKNIDEVKQDLVNLITERKNEE